MQVNHQGMERRPQHFARSRNSSSRPYQFKDRTTERGRVWDEIAERLNGSEAPVFRVTKRSVRDRYKLLIDKYKRKMRNEEKASGIEVEPLSELDQLLENLISEEETAAEKERRRCNIRADQ